MRKIKLFLTAFLQVSLVSVNVYQISHGYFIGALIVGFLISLFWTINVKSVAFGNWVDKLVYCTGAGIGTYVGMVLSTTFYTN